MTTRWAFTVLVLLVASQRLWETFVSRRHVSGLLAQGGREHAAGQLPWMIAIHASWLCAMLAEVWLLDRPFIGWLAALALPLFGLGQVLRIWAMRTLGPRWTVKVITLPTAPPVVGGPFRYLRHPNYLGVVLEIAALPLVHTAFLSAALFSAANGLLLWFRIRAEEAALQQASDYAGAFAQRPRMVPLP
jgi:methyltransferase